MNENDTQTIVPKGNYIVRCIANPQCNPVAVQSTLKPSAPLSQVIHIFEILNFIEYLLPSFICHMYNSSSSLTLLPGELFSYHPSFLINIFSKKLVIFTCGLRHQVLDLQYKLCLGLVLHIKS